MSYYIFNEKRCFLSFEKEKWNFTTFGFHRKMFLDTSGKIHYCPPTLENILPTPMPACTCLLYELSPIPASAPLLNGQATRRQRPPGLFWYYIGPEVLARLMCVRQTDLVDRNPGESLWRDVAVNLPMIRSWSVFFRVLHTNVAPSQQ